MDELSKEFIRTLKGLLYAPVEVQRKLQAQGVNVIPATFYSNIPTVTEIENSFEYHSDAEIYNAGIFDRKRIGKFVARKLSRYSREFCPPMEGDRENPSGFFWKAPAFSHSDAMAYYCMIRHVKPMQVLEVGSGFSTLIADEALKRNGRGQLVLIEPFPKDFLRRLDTVDRIIESRAQDIPVGEFVRLVEASGIWFIDSTHTVKTGSDCLYLYLKVMPEVRSEVVVHSHDIFLPFGMPRKWALARQIYWTEQYLLYAYMLENPKVEVLFGSKYVNEVLPDTMSLLMDGKWTGGGGSLWYRLNRPRLYRWWGRWLERLGLSG